MDQQTGQDPSGQPEHDARGAQPDWLSPAAARRESSVALPDATSGTGVSGADPAGPPAAVPVVASKPVPATGEPRVDAALRLLDRLPGLPVSDHPELFEQVHAQLSGVLGELDPGAAAGRGPAGA
jgi:hypothetical protein